MGGCQSLQSRYEDPDDRDKRIKDKRVEKELQYHREQLRRQRQVFSELDINGKGISRGFR